MRVNCNSDLKGKDCPACSRHFDDCDGDQNWGDYNGEWLPIEEIEERVAAEVGEQEWKAKHDH